MVLSLPNAIILYYSSTYLLIQLMLWWPTTRKLLCCYFANCTSTVMNHNVHMWYAGYDICPWKGSSDPTQGATTHRMRTAAVNHHLGLVIIQAWSKGCPRSGHHSPVGHPVITATKQLHCYHAVSHVFERIIPNWKPNPGFNQLCGKCNIFWQNIYGETVSIWINIFIAILNQF